MQYTAHHRKTAAEYQAAQAGEFFEEDMHDSVVVGLCLECGFDGHSVEPDASGYTCDDCEAEAVVSVVELCLAGLLDFTVLVGD